jgi:iron complex outermembrane receptor protein
MSLTRSYRAANLNDLIARPVFNSQFPSGPNTEFAPDRAGNPDLKPELATGLELAFESYLPKNGLLSANLFSRQIKGLIRNVLTLENTSLNGVPVQRWVSRPRNLGNAQTYGLELEAKARLDELWTEAPPALVPLQVRANLSLFASKVDGIPGPHNRIDAQPRATANLGADYRLPGTPWSMGANWSWTPEVIIQQTEILESRTSKRVVLDGYVQYAQSRNLTWRLGLSNLAPLDSLSQTVVNSGSNLVTTEDRKRTFATWNLRAEMRF